MIDRTAGLVLTGAVVVLAVAGIRAATEDDGPNPARVEPTSSASSSVASSPPATSATPSGSATTPGATSSPQPDVTAERRKLPWQTVATRYARAFTNTRGGAAAWRARLRPWVTSDLAAGYRHTDLDNLPTGAFKRLQRLGATTNDAGTRIRARLIYKPGPNVDITLTRVQDAWVVTAAAPTQDPLDHEPATNARASS